MNNISRRNFIFILSALLLSLGVMVGGYLIFNGIIFSSKPSPYEERTIVKKPNIMFIFADDVGTGDVPGYWNRSTGPLGIFMPHLRDLVSHGTTFTDAHSTPLCATSRYVFLSGNYQHRGEKGSGVWNLNYKRGQFVDGQQSIAQVLHDNGYNTAMFGKWHLGGKNNSMIPYQHSILTLTPLIFDFYHNTALTKQGKIPTKKGFKPDKPWLVEPEKTNILSTENHNWTQSIDEGPKDIGFNHSYITIGGIQNPPYIFFRDGRIQEESFYDNIKMWKKGTHKMPEGKSKIKVAGEGISTWDSTAYNMIIVNETEAFIDRHLEEQKDDPFFTYLALGSVHKPHSPPYEYLDGTPIAGEYDDPHLELLVEMDKVVGSLIDILTSRKILNDTIVVFTSDNGGVGTDEYTSGPLREKKGSLYEGGHRIPMTFRWDSGGIPRGESRSHLVSLNDLYSTFCNLVGIDVPESQAMDSISFARYLLDGTNLMSLREMYGVWSYKKNSLSAGAIRMGPMKLIHNYDDDVFELYDLSKDLSEMNDISEDKPNMAKKMSKTLRKLCPKC